MSAQVMMPATPGAGSLGTFSADLNHSGGVGGSSLDQPSQLGSAWIKALVAAFEEIMSGKKTGLQDGSAAPGSLNGVEGGSSGNGIGNAADPLNGPGSTAQANQGATEQNPSDLGTSAGSNLPLELLKLLASAGASQMPDSSSSPTGAGSPGGAGGGTLPDQALPMSPADGAPPPPAHDPATPSGGGPVSNGSQDAGAGNAAGGSTIAVDGAKPGGNSVDFQIVNNTGKEEKVALTNAQNQKFSVVDLKPGQKADELLDPNDPNTKSARLQTLNPDGSLKQDAKLTEFNLQPGQTAINVSNNNFAGDYGLDGHKVESLQMKINDHQGKEEGDGTVGGSYDVSAKDQTKGPNNPMKMGQDRSNEYTITLGSGR